MFAEAVLGRSNSAEKLDITRFWNWQDSPIPLAPTEIAPISAGSRAQGENLTPGQLGAPVLNITNPTTLPDPAGVGAAFTALAQSQLFRDMSGLAGTQTAAQAASANTLNAATAAGQIASQNFKIATDQATAMGQAAADLWKVHKTGKSGGSGGGNSGSNVSTDGAKVNLGRDLDERGVSGAGQGGGGQKKPIKITQQRSEFQGAGGGGAPPPPPSVVGSRELAFADDVVAVSGSLIGAVADALGVGGPVRAFGAKLETAVLDALMIGVIERDAASLGINLGSAKLLPMDSHANSREFKEIYGAWTNSAGEVFINLDGMRQAMATDDVDALKEARATAIFIVQHEEEHIQQFTAGGGRPATFQQMAGHEFKAYGDDLAFLAKPSVKNHFVNVLKMDPNNVGVFDDGSGQQTGTGLLGSIRAEIESNLAFLQQHKDDADDAALKKLMIDSDFLPASLQGNDAYTMEDLYTK